MPPRPLSPAEQYGFTNGWCNLFAWVAQPLVGGVPTVLVVTDPRQLREHDWPPDMPLALHVFLTLPDGSVVDAEGRRSLEDLKHSFGVRRGYRHTLVSDPNWERTVVEFGDLARAPVVQHHLRERLLELDWKVTEVPEAQGLLQLKPAYREAQTAWNTHVRDRYFAEVRATEAPVEISAETVAETTTRRRRRTPA